jgi:dTDP-4-amino-4,6-dideoxygalactose transaminase
MFFRLPPAGERIPASDRGPATKDYLTIFSPYAATFYGSGTQALAAALIAAVRVKGIPDPEVILPAYTCPALVSAVLYAGAKPVLVDLTADRPWMNLEELAAKVTSNTAAIIAVHLFGIPERISAISDTAVSCGAMLIEDSAQRLPEPDAPPSQADFVILSFGRGKPLSVLGGGAVLATNNTCREQLPHPDFAPAPSLVGRALGEANIACFNFLLPPARYWMVAGAPFLHLGETRFLPLGGLCPMPESKLARLMPAVRNVRQRHDRVHESIRRMVAKVDATLVLELATACGVQNFSQLSRYPLLLKTAELRNTVLRELTAAGLGASAMYPAPLPRIPGLEEILESQGPLREAENFSSRILTLPTHSAVTEGHIERMHEVLLRALQMGN